MILTKRVKVTISRQGKHYASLGYGVLKQGTTLLVNAEHLPPKSNVIIKCQCDECKSIWKATYQSVKKQGEFHRCFDCTRKQIGKTMDMTNTIAASKLRVGPLHPRWNPNTPAFKKYSGRVHWLTKKTYDAHKATINPLDYPRTLCGVEGGYQLDHKVSIKEGFLNDIPAETLAAPRNLQMLPWHINRTKW